MGDELQLWRQRIGVFAMPSVQNSKEAEATPSPWNQ